MLLKILIRWSVWDGPKGSIKASQGIFDAHPSLGLTYLPRSLVELKRERMGRT